jgi:chemotaxis signal transduction protein
MLEQPQPEPVEQTPGMGEPGFAAPLPGAEPSSLRQFCIFRVNRERYALSVLEVEEVVEFPRVTPLPLGPPFLIGISNLRGVIVPIIDIAFAESHRPDSAPSRLIVAAAEGKKEQNILRIGLAADEVLGTYITSEPLLTDEAPREMPHCSGLLRHGEHLALVLDLRRLAQAFPVTAI